MRLYWTWRLPVLSILINVALAVLSGFFPAFARKLMALYVLIAFFPIGMFQMLGIDLKGFGIIAGIIGFWGGFLFLAGYALDFALSRLRRPPAEGPEIKLG